MADKDKASELTAGERSEIGFGSSDPARRVGVNVVPGNVQSKEKIAKFVKEHAEATDLIDSTRAKALEEENL